VKKIIARQNDFLEQPPPRCSGAGDHIHPPHAQENHFASLNNSVIYIK